MDDGEARHRGTPNPAEFPVGRWTLLALSTLVAGILIFADTGLRFTVGAGLFAVSMTAFYRTVTLIKRGYPELDEDD